MSGGEPSGDPNARLAQANELLASQRAEEAEAVLRDLLVRVQHPELHFRLGVALLMQGRLREGFGELEGRPSRQRLLKRMSHPEWDGQVAGRAVIVWGEQGLGDEIQGARFLPLLRDLGPRHVTFACRKENVRAFERIGVDVVVDRDAKTISIPKDTCWIALWSLPHRLGLRAEDISGAPYLKAEPAGPGGIGLVERGNPQHPHDDLRSIPHGELQRVVPKGRLMATEGDVHDSLRQVAALDLLITVDTAWAHMAGALGIPCWLLLPHRGLDWRWLREGAGTRWYDSLRIYRQSPAGGWGEVLGRVAADLRREGIL